MSIEVIFYILSQAVLVVCSFLKDFWTVVHVIIKNTLIINMPQFSQKQLWKNARKYSQIDIKKCQQYLQLCLEF